jgi:hypothetical protein
MGEAENRQTVERVFQALTEGQVELFHAQFHEDSVIEFPQTGERIVCGENRRAVYRTFPGGRALGGSPPVATLQSSRPRSTTATGSTGARSSSTSSATGRSRS